MATLSDSEIILNFELFTFLAVTAAEGKSTQISDISAILFCQWRTPLQCFQFWVLGAVWHWQGVEGEGVNGRVGPHQPPSLTGSQGLAPG